MGETVRVTGPGVTQTDEGRKSQVSLITSRESLAFCKQYSVTKLPGGHQIENQPDSSPDFKGVFIKGKLKYFGQEVVTSLTSYERET